MLHPPESKHQDGKFNMCSTCIDHVSVGFLWICIGFRYFQIILPSKQWVFLGTPYFFERIDAQWWKSSGLEGWTTAKRGAGLHRGARLDFQLVLVAD